MKTPDARVYSLISMLMERKLQQIIGEVKVMQTQSQQTKEHFSVHAIIQHLKGQNSELLSKMTD